MAPKLNFILANRFNEALDRLLGMEGEPGMDTLSPELAGAIVLQNDRDELKALLGERLCVASSGNIAAVGGQNGFATLANLAGSGVLLVVLAAYFEPTTAGILQVSLGIGAPLGAQQGVVSFR